jgi:acetolactate synthase-1/2/3 large subunit
MHGSAFANYAIHEADVVVALGARFDDRVTGDPRHFATQAQFIQVEVDPSEINKNVTVQVPVIGHLKEALKEMAAHARMGHYGPWYERIEALKRQHPFKYKPGNGEIKPQYFLEKLHEVTEGKALLTTGVGQHQMWAFQYYKFDRPRRFITSGGAGTMGFGLPAAIGAQVGCPDDLVIDIDGDGSFEMNLNDMRTVADNNLPVKAVILNNHMLGMVGQWQRKFYAGNYSSVEFSDEIPNFSAGCRALYGVPGRKITRREEVVSAIEEMVNTKGPYVLDVIIPKEEDVYPMIPAGKTVRDMILGEEQGHTPPV